jgi:hypothetical protein
MLESNFLRGYEVNGEVLIEEFYWKGLVKAFEGELLNLTRGGLFQGEK